MGLSSYVSNLRVDPQQREEKIGQDEKKSKYMNIHIAEVKIFL